MNNKIQKAFDHIHADEALKQKTKNALAQKARGSTAHLSRTRYRIATAFACLALVLIGCSGYWVYFTPTAAISLDINPSIELEINRFDQVVSINGRNDDEQQLAQSLDIKYSNYATAINTILEDDEITALLSQDEILTIAVTGKNKSQCGKILSAVKSCTAEQKNTYCYAADPEEMAAAQELDLPYGKYLAYLELHKLDSNITPEEIRNMTMREIRNRIQALSPDTQDSPENNSSSNRQGQGHGHGYGYGKSRP